MVESTSYKTFNNKFEWRIDQDGLLRCTTNVLKRGVLNYSVAEIGNVPVELRNRKTIKMYVPDEELENAGSLSSLEGKPISVDHLWQTGGSIDSVGNVAGSPTYNKGTGFLSADILITDPATIKRITSGNGSSRLVDQSAAYRNTIDWVPGITPDGESFDGIQRNIEYNHIALLPQGSGRAGEEVRILNKDRSNDVADEKYTWVKMGGERIRVMNEDLGKMDKEMEKKDKEVESANEAASEKDEKAKKDFTKNEEETKKLKSENEGLQAQITTLKETIADVTSPTSIQAAMNKALEEQNDSVAILNSFAKDSKQDFEKEIKSLNGHELRQKVVQRVRTQNKRPELTAEEASNEGIVLGMFTALKDTAAMVGYTLNRRTIAGADVVKTMNSGGESAGEFDTPAKRQAKRLADRAEHFKQV